jgi:hypothetical protein
MNILFRMLVVIFLSGPVFGEEKNDSEHQECRFTSVPNAVCSISFYRLIAVPSNFDGKYVSVIGFLVSDNGRLAIFPNKESYLLYNAQESISISEDLERRDELFEKYGGNFVRLVGRFTYSVRADASGIGHIGGITNIFKIRKRIRALEDQSVTGTADEVSRFGVKHPR